MSERGLAHPEGEVTNGVKRVSGSPGRQGSPESRRVDGDSWVVEDPTRLVKRRWATLGSDPLRINQAVAEAMGPVAWPLTMSGQVHRPEGSC